MPIRRQFKYLNPIDWPQISVMIRSTRAKGRCECCDRPHGQTVQHLGDGRCGTISAWSGATAVAETYLV